MTTTYLITFTAVSLAAVALAWRRRAWLVVAGLALFALWPLEPARRAHSRCGCSSPSACWPPRWPGTGSPGPRPR